MEKYKKEFIEFAIKRKALCFGEYKLKSGRVSPYFFNTGLFSDGESLAKLGRFYAEALQNSDLEFEIIYGPSYKGIPLASAMANAFYEVFGENYPFCFNRKEIKDHGEGGIILGAKIQNRVIIVDDVISALITILKFGKSGNLYWISSGEKTWFHEIGQWLNELTNTPIIYTEPPQYTKKVDVGNFVVDNSKLRSLGWAPKITVKDGIKKTLEYFKLGNN